MLDTDWLAVITTTTGDAALVPEVEDVAGGMAATFGFVPRVCRDGPSCATHRSSRHVVENRATSMGEIRLRQVGGVGSSGSG